MSVSPGVSTPCGHQRSRSLVQHRSSAALSRISSAAPAIEMNIDQIVAAAQAAGIAAWQRDGPLLYSADQLVFVPGLGIDARVQAPPGSAMLGLRWLPDDVGDPGS